MKTKMVILQPTSLCNIDCRYCYLPHRQQNKRMSITTLERIAQALFDSSFLSDELTIVWHMGEPLLLSQNFYSQALEIFQRYNTEGIHLTHAIQTNGALLTQQWCDFIKVHDIHIGVSLDGPQNIHDQQRVDKAKNGTFTRVLRGVTLLQENNIPFSVIAVITKATLSDPYSFWQFFMQLHPVSLGFNPEEIEGINTDTSLRDADIAGYKEFFKVILALNASVENPLMIREVNFLTRQIRDGLLLMRSEPNSAMTILSFDHAGNISTFSPELLTTMHSTYGNFIFGNVYTEPLEALLTNAKFRMVRSQIERGVVRCLQTCDYFMLCGGGSPSNKVFEHGTFDCTETTACRLRIQAATNALLEHMEEHVTPSTSVVSTATKLPL